MFTCYLFSEAKAGDFIKIAMERDTREIATVYFFAGFWGDMLANRSQEYNNE